MRSDDNSNKVLDLFPEYGNFIRLPISTQNPATEIDSFPGNKGNKPCVGKKQQINPVTICPTGFHLAALFYSFLSIQQSNECFNLL